MSAGCRGEEEPAPLQPAAPEQYGKFLDEPAGVPPDPLKPSAVQVWLTAASEPSAAIAALHRLSGVRSAWPPTDRSAEAQFLARFAAWYADSGRLRSFIDRKAADPTAKPPTAVAPKPETAVVGGATFKSFEAVQRQELLKLTASGARGHLVLWYPLAAIRKRLVGGGRAGVWRGITRLREGLGGTGPQLGGTPVFFRAAIPAVDVQLLKGRAPAGFRAIGELGDFLPAVDAAREDLVRRAGGPDAPKRGELPEAWRGRYRSPTGADVAWLLPKDTAPMASGFDQAVEGLMPIVKQGGKAWILVALPLAEERKPERF